MKGKFAVGTIVYRKGSATLIGADQIHLDYPTVTLVTILDSVVCDDGDDDGLFYTVRNSAECRLRDGQSWTSQWVPEEDLFADPLEAMRAAVADLWGSVEAMYRAWGQPS